MIETEKNTQSGLIYWFVLFAISFFSYQQVIDTIRPNYDGNNQISIYLLGVAPNFFPAIGIPSLFVALLPQLKFSATWVNDQKQFIANGISISGLIIWEFIQTTSVKLHFDWNDVLWTFIGAIVFQFIWTITPERFKRN